MRAAVRDSLQWRLYAGLFAVIAVTGLVAGGLSFLWALRDANEILDGALEQTANLFTSGQVALPSVTAQFPGTEPDNDVLVMRLPPRAATRAPPPGALPPTLRDGLQTIDWEGKGWRVLVTAMGGGERLAVAQQTQVRDEIAFHSALRTGLPLLALVPLLFVLVREVVRRTLKPVSRLAHHVDSNPMAHAASLPDLDVPAEVQPFVRSIKRLLGELTAALTKQQAFVANAAHELRSPIAALRLQAANLDSVVQDGEARERLSRLQDGIVRIHALLDQLLSMARSQTGSAGPLQPVELGLAARAVFEELMPLAAAKNIDLGMACCEPGVCVDATPLDIATVLRNAVGNALTYGPAGGVVDVSVCREGGQAVLRVDDEGPGIPEEELRHVFEPFYRVPGTGQTGSGLGLAIVTAIARRLGAQVTLAARDGGQGVRFEYRQPLAVRDAADVR
jgi:two-component system OmpR family sensor kinase